MLLTIYHSGNFSPGAKCILYSDSELWMITTTTTIENYMCANKLMDADIYHSNNKNILYK